MKSARISSVFTTILVLVLIAGCPQPGPVPDETVDGGSTGQPSGTTDQQDPNSQRPATQTPDKYTLSISTQGSGQVQRSADGPYAAGTSVTLTAQAGNGYRFDHWEGDLSGANATETITMTRDRNVTVVFVQDQTQLQQYALTVQTTGSGSVNPAGGTFSEGETVNLTATPQAGWQFDHWEGAASGNAASATITMTADTTVTAVFVEVPPDQHALTVLTTGNGSVSPAGGAYDDGETVSLTATPDAGWRFDRWEGGASGTSASATITITADTTVTAVFIQQFSLTINIVGDGTVTPESGTYDADTIVDLTATAANGWTFEGWSGDLVSATAASTITMDADKTVTATFGGVAGFRTLTVGNATGSMTLVYRGANLVGVMRNSATGLGLDLDGQMVGNKLTVNVRWLNSTDAPGTIDASMAAGGALTGTYSAPGFTPEGFNAPAATATDFSNEIMGYWRIMIDNDEGRMALAQSSSGAVRGTASLPVAVYDDWGFYLGTLMVGLDVTGTIQGTRLSLTMAAGTYNFNVITDLAEKDRWTGQINGGGFTNKPFTAER